MNPILHFNMLKRRSRVGLLLSLGMLASVLLLGLLDETGGRWIAYLASCAAMIFALYQIPGSARVSLDADGIFIRSPFWKQKLDWRNLKGFVLVDFNQEQPGPAHNCRIGYLVGEKQREMASEFNRKLFAPLGCDGLLPQLDGVEPDKMVRLLNGVLLARKSRKAA